MSKAQAHILTINGGSSSIKFGVFKNDDSLSRIITGEIERVGEPDAKLTVKNEPVSSQLLAKGGHGEAIGQLVKWLDGRVGLDSLGAIGHRIVHGGAKLVGPCRITRETVEELERVVPLDPTHLPSEIAMIKALMEHASKVPQVACFDTAFHAEMPGVAKMLPIPRRYEREGVRRYGFHGLSFTYLMQELRRLDERAAEGKVILAHLGAGASLAAVSGGKCLDTTMSLTPTGGMVMATRSGDLDPGVGIYLMRSEKMNADQLEDLITRRSGLVGISETSGDMRHLLEARRGDRRAAEAVELFCYSGRKQIGAMAAAMGGVQTLVFSGGIGEHAAAVRAEMCGGLEFLGVRLDESRNNAGEAIISAEGASCVVRVIATDEESVIASQTRKIVWGRG